MKLLFFITFSFSVLANVDTFVDTIESLKDSKTPFIRSSFGENIQRCPEILTLEETYSGHTEDEYRYWMRGRKINVYSNTRNVLSSDSFTHENSYIVVRKNDDNSSDKPKPFWFAGPGVSSTSYELEGSQLNYGYNIRQLSLSGLYTEEFQIQVNTEDGKIKYSFRYDNNRVECHFKIAPALTEVIERADANDRELSLEDAHAIRLELGNF